MLEINEIDLPLCQIEPPLYKTNPLHKDHRSAPATLLQLFFLNFLKIRT